jgi:hypothetical protein
VAKRFSDTRKWGLKWFRELGSRGRDLRQFILDDCDYAGIWDIDFERVKFLTGIDTTIQEIRAVFKDELLESRSGRKIFLPAFIEFQYDISREPGMPKLNLYGIGKSKPNNAHIGVVRQLKREGFDPSPWLPNPNSHPVALAPSQPLHSPYVGAQEEEEEKDMDREQEKDKRGIGGDFPVLTPPSARPPGWENASTLEQAILRLRSQGQEDDAKKLESWAATLQRQRSPIGVSA